MCSILSGRGGQRANEGRFRRIEKKLWGCREKIVDTTDISGGGEERRLFVGQGLVVIIWQRQSPEPLRRKERKLKISEKTEVIRKKKAMDTKKRVCSK